MDENEIKQNSKMNGGVEEDLFLFSFFCWRLAHDGFV